MRNTVLRDGRAPTKICITMPMHIDASHPMCMTLQLDAQYNSRHEKKSTLWQEVMLNM